MARERMVVAGWLFERDRDENEGARWATLLHWGLCFAVIVTLHAGAAWIAMHWPPAEEPAAATLPAAVMIDLATPPAAPPSPPSEIPPGPKQEVAQPVPPGPVAQPILPPAPPAPAPKVEVPLLPKPKPEPPK